MSWGRFTEQHFASWFQSALMDPPPPPQSGLPWWSQTAGRHQENKKAKVQFNRFTAGQSWVFCGFSDCSLSLCTSVVSLRWAPMKVWLRASPSHARLCRYLTDFSRSSPRLHHNPPLAEKLELNCSLLSHFTQSTGGIQYMYLFLMTMYDSAFPRRRVSVSPWLSWELGWGCKYEEWNSKTIR